VRGNCEGQHTVSINLALIILTFDIVGNEYFQWSDLKKYFWCCGNFLVLKLWNSVFKCTVLLKNGYHLSVTKLNGLSPNLLFKYHQHKSFFHHQIKLFITKFNTFSPNKLIFESPNKLTSHQKIYPYKTVLIFYDNFVTKTKNLF
jgi:hypothetical protein